MISIAVTQALPEDTEVCLAPTIGEVLITNLDVTGCAFPRLYTCTSLTSATSSTSGLCIVRLTEASTYTQHRRVPLIQLQHRLIVVESKIWYLLSIQVAAGLPSQSAEVALVLTAFQLLPAVDYAEVWHPEFQLLAIGTTII